MAYMGNNREAKVEGAYMSSLKETGIYSSNSLTWDLFRLSVLEIKKKMF